MHRPWLANYPESVPATLDLDPNETLVSVAEASFGRFAERPAVIAGDCRMTYGELDDLSGRVANWLVESGFESGDRVAVMLPNLPQYPVVLLGILRAGLVCVNVNPLYTARELRHLIEDSGARALIASDVSAAEIRTAIDGSDDLVEAIVLTGIADLQPPLRRTFMHLAARVMGVSRHSLNPTTTFREIISRTGSDFRQQAPISASDLAVLQYTGGTTGPSKGAKLTHGNLVANIRQVGAWFGTNIEPGQELIVTALPLYHVYALTCNCLCYIDHGGANILIPNPRDLDRFVDEVARHKFTAITGVNTLYQALVNHGGFRKLDFSSLKYSSAGGMAVQSTTAAEWLELTGRPLLEGYGLSETSPVVCSNPVDIESFTGTVGMPLPGTDVSIRDTDGNPITDGRPGELCVAGPQVMSGYWNRDELDAQVFTEDGFLKTGDVATMDERGHIRIVDRIKDMVVVSGFNVYPNEVEDVVTQHPDIVEAACVGVPDDRTGEAVRLFVVAREGADIDVESVRAYCRKHLAAYKVPREVEFRDELPKTNVGKILRRELR